jgi:hypothetical protein
MIKTTDAPDFSFISRPLSVPGDLRIQWRVSLIVLMLGHSRAKRASLPKLHILNSAVRSKHAAQHLDHIINMELGMLPWTFRIEPAFARAIDFVVGDKLADWIITGGHSGLALTQTGIKTFKSLNSATDILVEEKALLEKYAKTMTEASVNAVIGMRRGGS